MKFSIVVPVYNTEKYLYDCIESVLRQTFDDYELILVNDGSTDSSGKICHEYADKNAKIKAYDKENSGQIESRSYGISKASGEYIVFLDSDDMLSDNALEVIKRKIIQHNCDMVLYDYQRFVVSTEVVNDESDREDCVLTQKELCVQIMGNEHYNSMCIKALKRSLLGSYDGEKYKHIRYGEDLLQTIDIIKQNPKTVIIKDKLYYYRINPTSLTRSLNLERLVSDVMFVRNVAFDYLMGLNILNDAEKQNFVGYSIRLIANCAAEVARSKRAYCDKVKFFTRIKESACYKKVSSRKYNKKSLGNRRIVWFLFKNGVYRLMIGVFAIKKNLASK